jgi:hypothetical protein
MRFAVAAFLLCAACGPKFYPPVIVGMNYAPKSVPENLTTTINGSVNFTSVSANVTQIVLGTVDATGNLIEMTPEYTGTQGVAAGTIHFGIPVTPMTPGTEQISVRLLDITGLSSEPSLGALTVEMPPDGGATLDLSIVDLSIVDLSIVD